MSIADKLTLLINTKQDIKSAISEKGVEVTGGMTTYADAIRRIETGGGGGEDYIYAPKGLKFGGSTLDIFPAIRLKDDHTDISYMFTGCKKLLSVGNINTANVTNTTGLFYNCNELTTIPQMNTSNVTIMGNMFYDCYSLKTIPQLDTSEVTYMNSMFYDCRSLTTIPQLDTSKVTNMSSMFRSCYSLKTIPQLNTSEVTNISMMFYLCYILSNLGGFQNLGQAYQISQSANYSNYTLDLSYATVLTEQSIINVLNNLYDIKTKGCQSQKVVLGSTNLAKLVSEEGQQALSNAQAKGWTLS